MIAQLLYLVISYCATNINAVSWERTIDERILSIHEFSLDTFEIDNFRFDWSHLSLKDDDKRPHILCEPLSTQKDQIKPDKVYLQGRKFSFSFIKKSADSICYVISLSPTECDHIKDTHSNISVSVFPTSLKIDKSIIDFLNPSVDNKKNIKYLTKEVLNSNSLSVEFLPYEVKDQTVRKLANDIFNHVSDMNRNSLRKDNLLNIDKLANLGELYTWEKIMFNSKKNNNNNKEKSILLSNQENTAKNCDININSLDINYFSRSIEISDISSSFESHCLVGIINHLSISPIVARISIIPQSAIVNFEARGITQGGKMNAEPYYDAGLTGKGQICGIADSGLNDISCFFIDDSHQYPTTTTNRDGVVEPLRRKVIQYISYADSLDDQGGHGTHVSGSVAGSSLGGETFSEMNGMAPDAKIAFFDLGMTEKSFLKVPALTSIFESAYKTGARIHTNSWGNLGGLYGQMSFDVDDFTFSHPDFLVLFAAGNSGSQGSKSIISPGNAKNALTVGAGQLRTVYMDTPLTDSTFTVASFSSLGPTFDGRIKPDVIAPGDFIMSAYSGAPDLLRAALSPDWKENGSCAVHQMSGTSMATPVTAGSALLVRQYFMDEAFWASTCNKKYSSCRQGKFTPSGYLLKCLFLHSGRNVRRYSDPVYDYTSDTYFSSFALSDPPDVFQGYGEVVLKNILPLQSGGGLNPDLDLILWDSLDLVENSAIVFEVDMKDAKLIPMKVTICWYDPPSEMGASSSLLLHDLDLIIESPNNELFLGNFGRTDNHGTFDLKTDDSNPNEQIFIDKPRCNDKNPDECSYKVYVQSYQYIGGQQYQKFSIVFTTSGHVSEPSFSMQHEHSIMYKHESKTASPTPALQIEKFSFMNASLYGSDSIYTSFPINNCEYLVGIEVIVDFKGFGSPQTMPYNIELTLVDPSSKAIAVGGIDMSVGIAKIITEWPDNWMSSNDGVYHANIGLRDAELKGKGVWTSYLMNSFSLSGLTHYNMTVKLKFEKSEKPSHSCEHRPSPAPVKTVDNLNNNHEDWTNFKEPTLTPTISPYKSKSFDIHRVSLGVSVKDIYLVQDSVKIASFNETGRLVAIQLILDPFQNNRPTYGANSWLLAVTVKSPNGLLAQIGGYEWRSREDLFYSRRWPDPWLGKESGGRKWYSSRDVYAANLNGSLVNNNNEEINIDKEWSIEIALGYAMGERKATNYSGKVVLLFSHGKLDNIPSSDKIDIKSNNSSDNNPPVDSKKTVVEFVRDELTKDSILLLCLFALLIIVTYYYYYPKSYERNPSSSNDYSRVPTNVNETSNHINSKYSQIDMKSDLIQKSSVLIDEEKVNNNNVELVGLTKDNASSKGSKVYGSFNV